MASRNNSIVAPLPDSVVKKHGVKTIESNNAVTGAQNLTLKQSIMPVCLVTILFFLWGFAYGLLDVLNAHFQVALGITKGQSGGLQAAYFGAYAIGPLTYSGWIVRRFGYRWAFITGLCIYGVGALMFWPSGLKRSFGGFCGSMFIVGSGLSTLETAANPFIATCGPAKYSELRLTLAQAFQAVGTVVAPVLASQVIFKNVDDTSLQSVQWVYLGIGESKPLLAAEDVVVNESTPLEGKSGLAANDFLFAIFVFILAVVFFFAPIPEVTDADMAAQAASSGTQTAFEDKPLSKQYTLFFGVAAQFCYVGAQCAYAGYFINYVSAVRPGTTHATGANLLAVAQGCFAIGRFVASGLLKITKPRLVLIGFLSGVVLFACLTMGLKGNAGIASISLVLFFESCVFPLIFALSIRGLGRHSKRGASFIVAAVSGGALFPPVLGTVADHIGTQKAFFIPLIGFVIAWMFPLYLNLFKAKSLDGWTEEKAPTSTTTDKDVESMVDDDEKKGAAIEHQEIRA
ncbi:putative L-fucose-proton symporter [Aureobasidium pullulans]|uniref:L-fucose-proton symporter n=1 Tax=Aureobasidium pullulans TaxID=5580 RepID=A0A4S9BGP0_AURPU|nr:putative L-fucose-proton symporter [Aureobasidium pullulans]THV88460.1 putative L-fucose-proton symporter [Aureobasidium pullulans]THW92511.1 putative L-fucose-proton symporter [Aureobasidium pullulans]THX31173.1 putative L-fucose-proton symporter [Aureobasidium pullulans]THX45001.1 putative L-fucose-proton symporter [Aureobasidium pullulans]